MDIDMEMARDIYIDMDTDTVRDKDTYPLNVRKLSKFR
jgi:hypothetical protein